MLAKQKRRVGFALRSGFIDDAIITTTIRQLIKKGYEVVLLPFSLHPDDARGHDGRYMERFLLPGVATTQTIEQTLEKFGSCDVIVGMRLHSMILAIVYSKPLVAISYGTKTRAIMGDHDVPFLSPTDVTADTLLQSIEKAHEAIS